MRTTYHGNRSRSELWLLETAGGPRPLLYIRPIPDEYVAELYHRFREVGVSVSPCMNYLWTFHLEALGDFHSTYQQLDI